jgi:hypothetical protein
MTARRARCSPPRFAPRRADNQGGSPDDAALIVLDVAAIGPQQINLLEVIWSP